MCIHKNGVDMIIDLISHVLEGYYVGLRGELIPRVEV
jgi:hypothetical protein